MARQRMPTRRTATKEYHVSARAATSGAEAAVNRLRGSAHPAVNRLRGSAHVAVNRLRGSVQPGMPKRAAVLLGLILAALVAVSAVPAAAHDLSPADLKLVGFRQHIGDSLPLELAFVDEFGQPVTLHDFFGANRPVLLTLNYFHCQNLCPLELQGLVDGLNGVPFTLGDQYTVLTVSFDARETPRDAADAKFKAFRGYVHPEAAGGWHLLTTNDQSTIDRLTQAVGFEYVYDPQENDYAHPAGVMILTPSGAISRYIYGMDFSANDLRLGLVEAASNQIGDVVDQVLLICYHYDPISGRYTPLVMNLMKAGGAATLAVVGGVLFFFWRADLRRGAS
jgi:protein SCO1